MSAAAVVAAPSPAADAAAASSSSSAAHAAITSSASSSPVIHSFSFAWMESQVHAQIWFLRGSLFVWVGDHTASMHSLTLAIKSHMDASPSVSCLLGRGHALGSGSAPSSSSGGGGDPFGGEEDQVGLGMASRIAGVFGIPVFVSLNLSTTPPPAQGGGGGFGGGNDAMMIGGGGGPEQQIFVERAIIKELRIAQKLGMLKPAGAQ